MTERTPPILLPERIKFIKKAVSKKNIFDLLTKLLVAGQSEISPHTVFDALIQREKLGNTSIGNEIALPRAHIETINPRAALLVLKKPLMTTDSIDNKGIRIFLALLIPEKQRSDYIEVVRNMNQTLAIGDKLHTLVKSKNPESLSQYFNSLLTLQPTNNMSSE
jgi:PTS system nitrogen regulatory IIA component